MALVYWCVGLALLTQSCMSSPGQTERGCKTWKQNGKNVCCDECYAGNRLVKSCGLDPKTLCTPCEPGTFTLNPKDYRCTMCTRCVGAQVHVKNCTTKSDTQCGCREGLSCGDASCSFCVDKCAKGHEPTADYSCRPCPHGTFNDKSHGKCKPWSTTCPDSNQVLVADGSASSDIVCVTVSPITKPVEPKDPATSTVLYMIVITVLLVLFVTSTVVMIIAAVKIRQKRQKKEKQLKKTPIIRTPTDDPRTLIAIECSFHEAQQEQGNSTESLIKEPSEGMTA